MLRYLVLAACLCFVVGGNIDVDVHAVAGKTLRQYVSVDMDWWTGEHDGSGGDWAGSGLLSIDLGNRRLRNLAAGLAPGFLRLGGSLDTAVRYDMGNNEVTKAWCKDEVSFRNVPWHLCLNQSRWDEVLDFASDAGLEVIFGLSWLGVNGGPSDDLLKDSTEVPPWNYTNPEALLRYTASKGHTLYAVELGEEMTPSPGTESFSNLVNGYAQLQQLLGQIWPLKPPRVLGPCVGMADESGGPNFGFMRAFLNTTLHTGTVDSVCMHSYNNDGGDGWKRPGFLNQTRRQAEIMLAEVRKNNPNTPLWCGECGPHNGGGVSNITDRFISSFWYADALGGLARMGLQEFGRQSLVGSHYGLVEAHTFFPNPDYWVALLFTRLMGPTVLDVVVQNDDELVNVYAHCSAQRAGAISIVVVNIDGEHEKTLNLTALSKQEGLIEGKRLEWHLTSASLSSKAVSLNGRGTLVLNPQDDKLPELAPLEQPASTVMKVAPYSIAFAVLEQSSNGFCA